MRATAHSRGTFGSILFKHKEVPMTKSLGTLLVGMVIAVALMLVVPMSVSASPAINFRDTLCFVRDANGVRYTVACQAHMVVKFDDAGNLAFVHYEDHAKLPDGAALPATATHTIVHVDCGCFYDGDYVQVLMPNGLYMSYGPIH
jgi:hypothetical protein